MFTIDYRPAYTWPTGLPYRLKMWDGSRKLPLTFCRNLDDALSFVKAGMIQDCTLMKDIILRDAQVPAQIMPGVTLDRDFLTMKTVLKVDVDQIDLAKLLSWINMHHRQAIHDA